MIDTRSSSHISMITTNAANDFLSVDMRDYRQFRGLLCSFAYAIYSMMPPHGPTGRRRHRLHDYTSFT